MLIYTDAANKLTGLLFVSITWPGRCTWS